MYIQVQAPVYPAHRHTPVRFALSANLGREEVTKQVSCPPSCSRVGAGPLAAERATSVRPRDLARPAPGRRVGARALAGSDAI